MQIVKNSTKVEAGGRFSKFASRFYSQKKINKMIEQGKLNGNPMEAIFMELLKDPQAVINKPDKKGNQDIYYYGKNIGWINPARGIGYIDEKQYKRMKTSGGSAKKPGKKKTATPAQGAEKPWTQFSEHDELLRASTDITASRSIKSKADLSGALEDLLDEDLCVELVDLAVSDQGVFVEDQFIDSDTFFDDFISNDDPKDIALKFFNGEDLDDKGPANPNRDYFRFDGYDNIESTNDPGKIYYDILLDEIIDFILDNLEDVEYPEEVQDLIDEYLGASEEE